MSRRPRILIVTPALAAANNGNWQTARRWGAWLESIADVEIADAWYGHDADLLIALHARRSGEAIDAFHACWPERPIVLVLTGTDVYRDIHTNALAQQSLDLATRIVALQEMAQYEISPWHREKVRVIYQSHPMGHRLKPRTDRFEIVCIGHLRNEKDPWILMEAARRLPKQSPIRLVQIGRALDPDLERAAREAAGPHYEWVGELPHHAALEALRHARALLIPSVMEGGANVIVEAVMHSIRVLASKVSGNVGMLGLDYEGYFVRGDADDLTALLLRTERSHRFRQTLKAQCVARQGLFDPRREHADVNALVLPLLPTLA